MNNNKINNVLKSISKELLSKEEVYSIITVLQRQYMAELVKETVMSNMIGADYVKALSQETVINYINTINEQNRLERHRHQI